MTDAVAVSLTTSVTSLIIALISGGISLWNRRKTDKNTVDLQGVKGAIDTNLEILRAQLSHRQSVSATQWNAEFTAYQAIWKAFVEVRPVADKLVNREGELLQLGVPEEYLNGKVRLKYRQQLTEQLAIAAKGLLSAAHDNAPFYPAAIRNAANEAHKAAIQLVNKNLAAIGMPGLFCTS